ncbi:MAG: phosphodiester glycosidase family protein [Mailhella sp.]
MMILRMMALVLLFSALPFQQAHAEQYLPEIFSPEHTIVWNTVEQGLDVATLSSPVKRGGSFSHHIEIRVLRFHTEHFEFRLFSSRWEGISPPTMHEWAEKKSLVSAINAGMYMKDGQSTGYMRSGTQTNNGRIVSRYGSFFVSSPDDDSLPRSAVLDRSFDDWQSMLPHYHTVVQNFRLMGPAGQQLWPEKGPEHAIAAIAEDLNGRILFLHCSTPVSVYSFVEILKEHTDLNIHSAMYMEGGSEASLMARLSGTVQVWNGMTPASYMLSSRGGDIPLPNILGVIRRSPPH